MNEPSRRKRIIARKTHDEGVGATLDYLDPMLWEGVPVKCLSDDGAGEPGRLGRFLNMLDNRGTSSL